VSNQYGVRDAACPISTKEGGGGRGGRCPSSARGCGHEAACAERGGGAGAQAAADARRELRNGSNSSRAPAPPQPTALAEGVSEPARTPAPEHAAASARGSSAAPSAHSTPLRSPARSPLRSPLLSPQRSRSPGSPARATLSPAESLGALSSLDYVHVSPLRPKLTYT